MLLIILVTRTNHDCIAFWAHLGIIWLLFSGRLFSILHFTLCMVAVCFRALGFGPLLLNNLLVQTIFDMILIQGTRLIWSHGISFLYS
jgi:hypothetical protein